MADVTLPPGGERRIVKPILASRILGRTFRTWITSLPQLIVIAALVCVPIIAARWFFEEKPGWRGSVGKVLPMVQMLAVASIGQAFAIRFVFQRLRGDATDLGRSIAIGRRRVGTVAAISLLLSLPLLAYLVAMLVVVRDLEPTQTGRFTTVDTTGILVASVAFYVFELIVALVYPVAAPAAVVEGSGVFASLRRSAILTKGRRATIFGIYFFYGLVCLLPGGTVAFVIQNMKPGTEKFLWRSAYDLVFASLTCILPIVLYHDLRETREGIGIDELAAAFD